MPFSLKQFLGRMPEKIRFDRVLVKDMPLPELGITLLYVLVAGLWSVFSDDIFDWVMGGPMESPALQAMKGINFVLTSGVVLYLVVRRSFYNRRRAEETSRLSQERFEAVALATTDAIWDYNLDTEVVWWSDGVAKLFGYRPEDVSTRVDWWRERLHPDDRERVLAAIREVADGGGQMWNGHYRFRRQDGSYAVVMDHGYIVRDAAGKPVRIVGGITDITERQRAEEAVESSRHQLRALSARLQSLREEERTRIAREIHDELGQTLTALKMDLRWVEKRLPRESGSELNPVLDKVVEASELADATIASVQRISSELRPSVLEDLGLSAALRHEAQRFQERTGIPCKLSAPDMLSALSRQVATAVFRIFQEALTNVVRHAEAKEVQAQLSEEGGQLVLKITDNGKGIRSADLDDPKSLGLLGMKERAELLGGEVTFQPGAHGGTVVTLRIPQGNEISKITPP